MKKARLIAATALIIACAFLLFGCTRDMNWIIDNEPCVRGVVSQINENYIMIDVNEDDELFESCTSIEVSLNVENEDGRFSGDVGDEVAVYYDGNIAETYPPRINKVYAILYMGKGE
ncbi:MAG: hypothetical protein Q4C01_02175 [Clostridia bacterium]|nr:hypothetical protein [Clostridia bacterium]